MSGIGDHRRLEDALGMCPLCGAVTGYRNIASDHWAYCGDHLTAWRIGSDMFASWHAEDQAIWTANIRFFNAFRVLETSGREAEDSA